MLRSHTTARHITAHSHLALHAADPTSRNEEFQGISGFAASPTQPQQRRHGVLGSLMILVMRQHGTLASCTACGGSNVPELR